MMNRYILTRTPSILTDSSKTVTSTLTSRTPNIWCSGWEEGTLIHNANLIIQMTREFLGFDPENTLLYESYS